MQRTWPVVHVRSLNVPSWYSGLFVKRVSKPRLEWLSKDQHWIYAKRYTNAIGINSVSSLNRPRTTQLDSGGMWYQDSVTSQVRARQVMSGVNGLSAMAAAKTRLWTHGARHSTNLRQNVVVVGSVL